jgi:ATP-dependent exoDNAse (exonuclease V) beta subunit
LTLDAVTRGYVPQVHAYAHALEKIYQKNVKQMLLYFFHMGKFVEV